MSARTGSSTETQAPKNLELAMLNFWVFLNNKSVLMSVLGP